jgi:ribose-phosphate pyrophosphokinase
MRLFALDGGDALAAALSARLDEPLAPHELRVFEDGECKLRPLVDPRGHDAYVIASLHGDGSGSPQDKLCRLLMFVSTLRDHGAHRVTAVVPYLAYARKDRRTKPFDPLSLRYVAQWFEAAGVDQLIVLEAHNVAALENAFRLPTLSLSAHALFDPLVAEWPGQPAFVVAWPDVGGVKRAQLWRESLQQQRPVGFAMIDKRRSAGVVSSDRLVAGDVAGADVLLLDDLIASGETMQLAARALREAGAREVSVFAAHGLFVGAAADVLADLAIARVVVSDSVSSSRVPTQGAPASAHSSARNASSSSGSTWRSRWLNSRQSNTTGGCIRQMCSGRRSPCPSTMRPSLARCCSKPVSRCSAASSRSNASVAPSIRNCGRSSTSRLIACSRWNRIVNSAPSIGTMAAWR